MADTGWILASGEGEQIINGGVAVVPVALNAYIETVTSPRVRIIGTGDPKRVQFGGSCGFGGVVTDNNGATVTTYGSTVPLEFERLYWWWPTKQATIAFADRVWWKLPPGIEWRLKFYW